MFEQYFNRSYDLYEFPYFVPKEEKAGNIEFARMLLEDHLISQIWNSRRKNGDNLKGALGKEANRIAQHGGLILDVCSGPSGGFVPAVLLLEDYDAHIMINDLCPTVVREWQYAMQSTENPPPNVEYAAFDVCDIPFADNSLDVISGYSAIINIEGSASDKHIKALSEIYRVLKKGGLFVMADQYITKEYADTLAPEHLHIFMERSPNIFVDFQDELCALGYESVETVARGTWSNKDDESGLATLTRSLGTELVFTTYTKYCIK